MFNYAKHGGKCVMCGGQETIKPCSNGNLCNFQWNTLFKIGDLLPPLNCIEAPFCSNCFDTLTPTQQTLFALEIIRKVALLDQSITQKTHSEICINKICDCGAIKANTTHSNWCSTQ